MYNYTRRNVAVKKKKKPENILDAIIANVGCEKKKRKKVTILK